MNKTIFLADTINTFLQCVLFISTINLCSKEDCKKPKSKMLFYIFLLWTMISLTTFFMGNSSVATLILHLVMLIIGGLIYKISYLYGLHLMGNYEKLGELLKNIIDGNDNIINNIVVSNDTSIISMIVNTINLKDITVFIDENADLLETNVNELDFQRIVSNILRNSIEALDGSGSIKINTYYSFNYFVLKIQNNGPEIPDKILNKIFDSGFTTKENKESNNGFGLAIVKELVESYNGKIQVSSTDEFTEFTIYLPTIK